MLNIFQDGSVSCIFAGPKEKPHSGFWSGIVLQDSCLSCSNIFLLGLGILLYFLIRSLKRSVWLDIVVELRIQNWSLKSSLALASRRVVIQHGLPSRFIRSTDTQQVVPCYNLSDRPGPKEDFKNRFCTLSKKLQTNKRLLGLKWYLKHFSPRLYSHLNYHV